MAEEAATSLAHLVAIPFCSSTVLEHWCCHVLVSTNVVHCVFFGNQHLVDNEKISSESKRVSLGKWWQLLLSVASFGPETSLFQ